MKRRNSIFITLVVVLFVAIIWMLIFSRTQRVHVASPSKNLDHEKNDGSISENQVLIQRDEGKEPTENFGSPDDWLVFNENYLSPYRRFRFHYPPTFEVSDLDSSLVWLSRDSELILGIDENPLIGASTDRTAQENHEQFITYHTHRKWLNQRLPNLSTIKQFDFDEERFVYKFTQVDEKQFPGEKIAEHDEWNHYVGVLEGYGIDIYDLKKLPEDVVLEIIKSIEFE